MKRFTSDQAIRMYWLCGWSWQTEMRMKRLMLPLIAALLFAGVAGSVLNSHAIFRSDRNGMASLQDMQAGQASKLPEQEELQDRSVLFAKEPAR